MDRVHKKDKKRNWRKYNGFRTRDKELIFGHTRSNYSSVGSMALQGIPISQDVFNEEKDKRTFESSTKDSLLVDFSKSEISGVS